MLQNNYLATSLVEHFFVYLVLRKFGKIWLYLRYPCCSSMNFDPSPVDKYNAVNSSNSGCSRKLSDGERFSCCSSMDFSSPVDKYNYMEAKVL